MSDQLDLAAWLRRETNGKLPSAGLIGPSDHVRARLPGATVLLAADSPDEPIRVELSSLPQPASSNLSYPCRHLLDVCAAEVEESSRGVDLWKVSPVHITFPIRDNPILSIDWTRERWSRARGGHLAVARDPDLWTKVAKERARFDERTAYYPGILVVHGVVIMPPEWNPVLNQASRHVLLCKRSTRRGQISYSAGCWSASFEEQLQVEASGRAEPPQSAARRGLAEELVDKIVADRAQVAVVAFFLEDAILNPTLLAVVEFPLTFAEAHRQWIETAPDRHEHEQIVAMPLSKPSFAPSPESLRDIEWASCIRAETELTGGAAGPLHPTTPLRLAVARWWCETRDERPSVESSEANPSRLRAQ